MADALNGSFEVAVLQISCLERSPHGGQVIVRLLVVVKHKEETLPNFFRLPHPALILITGVTALSLVERLLLLWCMGLTSLVNLAFVTDLHGIGMNENSKP